MVAPSVRDDEGRRRLGVPRSGLIFQRQDGELVLIDRMPHTQEMPVTPAIGRATAPGYRRHHGAFRGCGDNRAMIRRVMIESPYRALTAALSRRNITYAVSAMQDSIRRGEAPFLSHLLYTRALDDDPALSSGPLAYPLAMRGGTPPKRSAFIAIWAGPTGWWMRNYRQSPGISS